MPKVTIVIDCLSVSDQTTLEGFSGKNYGFFKYDAARTDRHRKLYGGSDSVYCIRFTPEEFAKIRIDLFEGRKRYDFYLPDVEYVEDNGEVITPLPPVAEQVTIPPVVVAAPVAQALPVDGLDPNEVDAPSNGLESLPPQEAADTVSAEPATETPGEPPAAPAVKKTKDGRAKKF